MHTDAHQYGEPLRSMRQEIAWHDKKEGQELLHLAQTSQRTDDPLDILVGDKQASGHVHYEVSDGNWYCDASPMSIPLYDGREARQRLELVHQQRWKRRRRTHNGHVS